MVREIRLQDLTVRGWAVEDYADGVSYDRGRETIQPRRAKKAADLPKPPKQDEAIEDLLG